MTRAADLAKLIAGSSTLGGTGELVLKDVDTADGSSPKITFQTGDTDIAADDVLGTIDFQAPDEGTGTDAILVSAGVEAKAEGDFSSSSNATSLTFKTGSSEAAAEKVRIDSSGNVMVGDTTTSHKFKVKGTGDLVQILSTNAGAGGAQLDLKHESASPADSDSVGLINFSGFDAGNNNTQYASLVGKVLDVSAEEGALDIGVRESSSTYTHSKVRVDKDGLKFNGDTATANALDDYEEGTWTPSVTVGGVSTANGHYKKIGGMVFLRAYVTGFTNSSNNETMFITGVPFTIATQGAVGVAMWENINNDFKFDISYLNGSSQVQFYYSNGGSYSEMRHTYLDGSNAGVHFTATYLTDQ